MAEIRWEWRAKDDEGSAPVVGREAFTAACAQFLKEGLVSGNWVYWVAEAGGEIVAHVCVQYVKKIPKPQRLHNAYGYVTNVYTKPKFRGQGIASELLGRVKSWAREHDLEFLITWPSEQGAALYERAGFVKENEALQCPLRPDSE